MELHAVGWSEGPWALVVTVKAADVADYFALYVFAMKPFYEARKFVLSLLLRQELIETNTCKKSASGPFIR